VGKRIRETRFESSPAEAWCESGKKKRGGGLAWVRGRGAHLGMVHFQGSKVGQNTAWETREETQKRRGVEKFLAMKGKWFVKMDHLVKRRRGRPLAGCVLKETSNSSRGLWKVT